MEITQGPYWVYIKYICPGCTKLIDCTKPYLALHIDVKDQALNPYSTMYFHSEDCIALVIKSVWSGYEKHNK